MTIPFEPVPIPAVVTRIAAGRPIFPAWANQIGGLTFRVDLHREAAELHADAGE